MCNFHYMWQNKNLSFFSFLIFFFLSRAPKSHLMRTVKEWKSLPASVFLSKVRVNRLLLGEITPSKTFKVKVKGIYFK